MKHTCQKWLYSFLVDTALSHNTVLPHGNKKHRHSGEKCLKECIKGKGEWMLAKYSALCFQLESCSIKYTYSDIFGTNGLPIQPHSLVNIFKR